MRKLILSLFLLLYSTTTSVAFTAINTNMVYENCKHSITQNTNTCTTTVEYDESCERKDRCEGRTIPSTDIYPNNEHPEYDYIQTCTIQPPLDPCKLFCNMTCLYECANGYYATTTTESDPTFVGTYARGYIYRTGGTVYNVGSPSESTGTLPHNGYYYSSIKCEKCPTGYKCEDLEGITGCADGYKSSYDSNNQLVCTKCKEVEMCVNGEVTGCNDTGTVGYYVENGTCIECPAGYRCQGGIKEKCSEGTYAPDTGQKACLLCKPGTYSGAGATSCEACDAGYYCPGGTYKQECPGKQDNSNVICNSEKTCAENDYVTKRDNLIEIYEKRQINNAYPQEITAITSVAIPSYLTSATKITECGVTYTVTNQRGTFVQEQIMYTEKQYDNPNNQTIFYTKILPGYHAQTQLYTQEQCTFERQKLYTDAVSCPAGQYCTGFEDGMPACDGNYPNSLGISGNIAAGYYSTGGGTSATPTEAGNGCLPDNECGPCNSGEYSKEGATSCTTCHTGYYCPDGTNEQACPVGTTSNAGATAITNCFINSNTNFCVTNEDRTKIDKCFNLPLPAGTTINLK